MMSFLRGNQQPKVCPKTGKRTWMWWLFPITGLGALLWFLIRVIPKPSRATYPCQRVAFPLASGFIVWLMGLVASAAAFHKAQRSLARAKYVAAGLCIVASIGFIWLSISSVNAGRVLAVTRPAQPANSPMGTSAGVNPGRVAWIWDANATNWAGPKTGQRWYSNSCTDQTVVNEMLSKALRAYTGKSTDYAAWDAIFRYFNQQRGNGDVGYTPGEKIAIKINHTLCYDANGLNPAGMEKPNPTWHDPPFIDCIDNSPQLTIALLKQLIDVAGVAPGDISIGDPSRVMPNYWYDMVVAQCPGVVYLTRKGYVGCGRTIVSWGYNAPFYWSDPCAAHWAGVTQQDYIPTHFAQAEYFINFPMLKSHQSGGVTVCGKNHYGSLIRNPNASDQPNSNTWYSMHASLPGAADSWPGAPYMGAYRALVDLMTHPQLGGKTLLYLVDALFASEGWDGVPSKWTISPFNNDWTSSIFVSQDGVATDSVSFDFLLAQWPKDPGANMAGSDDYLHEMALIPDPCSGTNYDPNNDGGLTESFGVHEHWNNSTAKKYSRNLNPATGTGIELVTAVPGNADINGDGDVNFADFARLARAWRSTTGGPYWDATCDISMPNDGVINELDLEIFCQNWLD